MTWPFHLNHWKVQIFTLWFIIVAKLQLWSSNENRVLVGVTPNGRDHCSRGMTEDLGVRNYHYTSSVVCHFQFMDIDRFSGMIFYCIYFPEVRSSMFSPLIILNLFERGNKGNRNRVGSFMWCFLWEYLTVDLVLLWFLQILLVLEQDLVAQF